MIIIRDTREKTPFDFSIYGIEQMTTKLDQGDYSICGYEDVIAIERKSSVSELAGNLGKGYARFLREMERLKDYEVKCILCEFPEEDVWTYPYSPGVPYRKRKYIKMRGKRMMSILQEIESEYDIPTIFSNDRIDAMEQALGILVEFGEGK